MYVGMYVGWTKLGLTLTIYKQGKPQVKIRSDYEVLLRKS